MRWSRRRARKIERTCLECGDTWTLDAKLAHIRPRRRRWLGFSVGDAMMAQNSANLGQAYLRQQTAAARDRQAQAEQLDAMFSELRACPKCGCRHFKEQPV